MLSVVWFACLCACLCCAHGWVVQNGRIDRDAIWWLTTLGTRNRVLEWDQDRIDESIRSRDVWQPSAMWPFAKLLWTHCYCWFRLLFHSQFLWTVLKRRYNYFACESGCKVLWWARLCVCVSVCLRGYLRDLHQFFVHVAYGRGVVAIRYILPVLWMTSFFFSPKGRIAVWISLWWTDFAFNYLPQCQTEFNFLLLKGIILTISKLLAN